ncbi:MAG: hypothetical protein HY912_13560, partial [Desulfomonile tiedjei]|nr:hypothetical protein [Desulfomonile tiedjei]
LPDGSARRALWACFLLLSLLATSSASKAQDQPHSDPKLIPAPDKTDRVLESLYPTWWQKPPKEEKTIACRDPGKCVTCHEATSEMDSSHALPCVRCHKGDSVSEDKDKAHTGLIKDPGDLSSAGKTCGECHPEETRRVQRSSMALAPRMINHTRFAFGAQEEPNATHASVDLENLRQVPHPSSSGNLVDDLLRRSCLRCHLHTKGSSRWGEHRGLGCSACHIAYPNSKDGRPRKHSIVRDTGITACLKCHNANHVGADYVGLFERDFHRGFKSPFLGGKLAPTIYGSEQHRLLPDVHFRAGMGCMDCHTLEEVHGTGEIQTSSENGVKISCEACHVRGDHPAVLKNDDGTMTLLRGEGRSVPVMNPQSVPHRIEAHNKNLRCSACHAAWSFQDYGLHLMLEERPDYWKWAPTQTQNDPQVQELLNRSVGTYAEVLAPQDGPAPPEPEEKWGTPETSDWLDGEKRRGAWFRAYTERKWSRPPLGFDSKGRVSVMRPMHQYVISHVDEDSKVLLDSHVPSTSAGFPALIFNPYEPHTISAKGRTCHECHGDPKAAGLGEGLRGIEKRGFHPLAKPETKIPGFNFIWDALTDDKGTALQFSSHPGAGPLDETTLSKLLNPSNRHKAEFYNYLKE